MISVTRINNHHNCCCMDYGWSAAGELTYMECGTCPAVGHVEAYPLRLKTFRTSYYGLGLACVWWERAA